MDDESNLVRRATMHKAEAALLSAAQEERLKEEVLKQQKGTVEDAIKQMGELQKISITQTMQDREYFYDNMKVMKAETEKIERARKVTEDAAVFIEEAIPKLEDAVEAMTTAEVNAEFVIKGVI